MFRDNHVDEIQISYLKAQPLKSKKSKLDSKLDTYGIWPWANHLISGKS